MKEFFKYVLATVTGIVISSVILIVIMFLFIGALISSGNNEKKITFGPNSIIKMELDKPIADRGSKDPFANFDFASFKGQQPLGLNDILEHIRLAKEDPNIKGIYLELSSIPAGIATIEEIRNALLDFKKSKKFIYAYSEFYTQKSYYLATVADKIFLNPVGDLEMKGLNASIMFFKNALAKMEVEPQVIRHGKFKSAVEPYILDKMSPENRTQTIGFIGGIWHHMVEKMAESRKMSYSDMHSIAEQLKIKTAEDALALKAVDKLAYQDEVQEALKKAAGIATKDDLKFVSFRTYIEKGDHPVKIGADRIAVIYANGGIESGEGDDETIGSETLAKAIKQARENEKVKAVVLRVNSPGGSALASDVIWRELILTKKLKPIVVSMGDVAASGGYYISCPANKIFASETTITGSIGVFGLMFNGKGLLNNKIGINVDTVKTNRFADIGSMYRPMTEEEKQHIQHGVEKIYDDFITKVGEGRKLDKTKVDSIGQGRVWSGIDAKKIGLVDEFGGLTAAIEEAAKLAKLKSYKITELPKQKEPFEKIMEGLQGNESEVLERVLGPSYPYYSKLRDITRQQGIMARMPFEIEIY